MNIQLIAEQIGHIHLTLETSEAFEVYGGTALAPFEVSQTGTAQWTLTVREKTVVAAPLRQYNVYARQLATGREWEVLSGKILVSARTAAVPADKLAPVEYFVTVPVVDHDVDAVGNVIVQGIPGPQGPKGDPGPPGEGGMTEKERATLAGAAQRDAVNTFTAANTFTGSVDMSTASVTPPEGWNVGELTPKAIQAVAPIAWGLYDKGASVYSTGVVIGDGAYSLQANCVLVGDKSYGYGGCTAIGYGASSGGWGSVAVGREAKAMSSYTTVLGNKAKLSGDVSKYSIAVGSETLSDKPLSITIGAQYTENPNTGQLDAGNVTHTCTTQGTGSITIGAGANTLNTTKLVDGKEQTVESSNSVTIGCKAENKGADSVVIGAQAKGWVAGSVFIGAGASSRDGDTHLNTALGANAKSSWNSVSVGQHSSAHMHSITVGKQSHAAGYSVVIANNSLNDNSEYATVVGNNSTANTRAIALGYAAKANAVRSMAIGELATVSDYGATVIRSTAQDGTYTQLYFSGANTPLANTYHDGAPMLGYVTKDSAGNIVAAGTRSLIDLLTDNSTFAPASLDENGEWVMPKVFHPSDLDLPVEEPSEVEEYTPLPVYPIVEPTEDELRTPTGED